MAIKNVEPNTNELKDAIAPIASLLSKSEKSQQKLKPGTWQHSKLQDNITALRIALSAVENTSEIEDISTNGLQDALLTLDSIIEKVR